MKLRVMPTSQVMENPNTMYRLKDRSKMLNLSSFAGASVVELRSNVDAVLVMVSFRDAAGQDAVLVGRGS